MIPADPAGAALAVAALIGVGSVMCVLLGRASRVRGAGWIAVATLAAHLIVSALVYARYYLFANDAQAYDSTAVAIAHQLGGDQSYTGTAVTVSHGKEGWVWLLGAVYHVVGHYPFVGIVLNAVLAACLVPIVGLITARLGWAHAARRAMWIGGFAPPLFIWSTFLLREPAINLTAGAAVAGAVMYLATRRWRWLLLTLLAAVGLYWLRGTVTVVLIGGLLAGLALAGRLGGHKMRPSQGVLLVAVCVVAVPLALRLLGSFGVSLDSINASRVALARTANSAFGAVSSSSSVTGSIGVAVRQLPDAMLGPFPWQWTGGLGGLLTGLDAVTWWVLLYYTCKAWRQAAVRRGRWVLAAPALLLFLALAVTSGNYGTLVRVRGMGVPVLAPLVAVGMAARGKRGSADQRRVLDPVGAGPPVAVRDDAEAQRFH